MSLSGVGGNYRYEDLVAATCNFSEENKLGYGACGVVYKVLRILWSVSVLIFLNGFRFIIVGLDVSIALLANIRERSHL